MLIFVILEWVFHAVWAILAFIFRAVLELFGEVLLSEGLSFIFDRPATRRSGDFETEWNDGPKANVRDYSGGPTDAAV